MPEGAFSKINRALRGARERGKQAGGVERRRRQTEDEELREKREKERLARARKERLEFMRKQGMLE